MRDVTPAQLALINRTVTEHGQTTTTRNYFVTSRPGARLDATQLLLLRRRQWGIESICHQRRGGAGGVSRLSLAFFQEDCRRRSRPVRDKTYPVWSGRLQRHPRPMLDRLLERCLPP